MEESNTTFVTLSEALPLLPVRFRFFQTAEDYVSIARLMNAVWQADQVESTTTVEEIAHLYGPRHNFEPGRQLLLAECDGRVIALARHWWMELRDGTQLYLHTHAVLPEYRGQGLEQALLHYNEHCLRVLAEQRQQVAVMVQLHRLSWLDFVQDSERATIALLEHEGYQPIRYVFDMMHTELSQLPSAPLPVDFQLHPIEPDHYPALYIAYKEAFADAFGSTPPSKEDYQRWIKRPALQFPELGQVAWQGDLIAGMVLCSLKQENTRIGQQPGRVEHVCVLPAWRGRGLATALLVQALTALREQGMTGASLMVDTQNAHGALRLYEKIGFRPIRRRLGEFGGEMDDLQKTYSKLKRGVREKARDLCLYISTGKLLNEEKYAPTKDDPAISALYWLATNQTRPEEVVQQARQSMVRFWRSSAATWCRVPSGALPTSSATNSTSLSCAPSTKATAWIRPPRRSLVSSPISSIACITC